MTDIKIKSVKCVGGQDTKTATSFNVSFENGVVAYVANQEGAKYYDEVYAWDGSIDPEFTQEELLAKSKEAKLNELNTIYKQAKANVFIEKPAGKIKTKYSIDSIQGVIGNKIDAGRFPDFFIINEDDKIEIKTLDEAEMYKKLLAQTLDNYWKQNYQPHQNKILQAKTIEELETITILMPDFIVKVGG